MATLMQLIPAVGFASPSGLPARCCCRDATTSSVTAAPLMRPISISSTGSCAAAPSSSFSSRLTHRHSCCQALPEPAEGQAPTKSILCKDCEGNGAIQCTQCLGEGINSVDHFNGRFKAGTICWLCRGKKQILCGSCNGAGFLGGFMNTQDD